MNKLLVSAALAATLAGPVFADDLDEAIADVPVSVLVKIKARCVEAHEDRLQSQLDCIMIEASAWKRLQKIGN